MASKLESRTLTAKDILLTSRPLRWLLSTLPFVIGYLTHDFHYSQTLAIGAFYFLFPFSLLVYGLNDISDYELDLQNPRKTRTLAKTKHLSLTIIILAVNLPYWFYFIHTGTRLSDIWLFLMIFMAAAYSLKAVRFKEIPLADSLTAGFIMAAPFMFGVVWASGQIGWLIPFATFLLWAAGCHAFNTIRDLTVTQKAKSESLATKLGPTRTLVVALLCYTVAALLATGFFGVYGAVAAIVVVVFVWLIARSLPYRRLPNSRMFQTVWRQLSYLTYASVAALSVYFFVLYRLTH